MSYVVRDILLTGAQASVLSRLKRAASSVTQTPHSRPVMTSPPTVSTSNAAGGDPTCTVAYRWTTTPAVFDFLGGTSRTQSSIFRDFPVYTSAGTTRLENSWRVRFYVPGSKCQVRVTGSTLAYRFIVNGQYISLTGTTTAGTTGEEYIILSTGGAALGEVIVESAYANYFEGVYVPSGQTVERAAPSANSLRMIVGGDSFTVGFGASFVADGWAYLFGDNMGITDLWASGSSGTGWLDTFGGTKLDMVDRITDITSYSPDVVVFALGANDLDESSTVSDIMTAVATCLTAVRVNCPRALIVVFGPWNIHTQVGVTQARYDDVAGAISSACRQFPGVIFVGADGLSWTKFDAIHPNTPGYATIAGAMTLRVKDALGIARPTPDYTKDFTASLPSAVTGTRSTVGPYFDGSGVWQSAAINTARIDHDTDGTARGLLVDLSQQNGIRNSIFTGAATGVIGSGGSIGTNWTVASAGLTANVLSLSTRNGREYARIKFSGMSSSTIVSLAMETTTQIAAVNGQNWVVSAWLSVVAAPSPPNNYLLSIVENNGAGTALSTHSSSNLAPTSTPTRYSYSVTLSQATVAFVRPQVRIGVPILTAIDFTIDLELPQCQLSYWASNPIKTNTAASPDVVSLDSISWFNASAGTIAVSFKVPFAGATSGAHVIWQIDDGTENNKIRVSINSSGNVICDITRSGGSEASMDLGAVSANTASKVLVAYAANDCAASLNGSSLLTDTSVTLPSGLTTFRLGCATATGTELGGWITHLDGYGSRLNNFTLQAMAAEA